jgi:hypothetical protein
MNQLTRLLQPFLGGNGRMAFITFISNSKSELWETMSSLTLAKRAKRVTNFPKVNAINK